MAIKKAKVINELQGFIRRTEDRGERAIAKMLLTGMSDASVLTPIDTSNLLNSTFFSVRRAPGKIIGTVGYSAAYALPVHDPDHPQNFRRASAEKEFLKKGFEQAEPNIRAVLKGSIKT